MRHRWLRILAGVLLSVAAAVALLYFVVLPRIVHQQVEALLDDVGLERARFDVEVATPWRARLADLALGPAGQVKVERIGVSYSPVEVTRGDVRRIRVSGLHLVIESHGGQIDLGPLSELTLGGKAGGGGGTPVGAVYLQDSQIILRTLAESIEIPLEGRLIAEGSTYLVRLTLGGGEACLLAGTINTDTGVMDLKLECRAAEADRVLAIVHALFPAADVDLEGPLSATASLHWEQGRGTLNARITAAGLAAPVNGEAAEEQEELGDTNLAIRRGVLNIDATFGPNADESLQLTLENAAVAGADFQAEGVSGTLRLTGFAPLQSPPGQQLQVERLEIGDVELADGTVQFQVESPTSLAIEQTAWNWLGGRVSTEDVELAPAEPIAFVLDAERIELQQLLDLLAEEQAEGTGLISGQLPVRIAPDGEITFGEGRFAAVGEGGLEIKKVEAIAGGEAGAELAAAAAAAQEPSQQEQVRQNIIEALKDFRYDVLKAELINEPDGGLGAKIRIAGKGRTGAQQAIDYTLNVRGLDVLLETLLEERRAIAESATREAAGKAGS